jgi:hypothetical protein
VNPKIRVFFDEGFGPHPRNQLVLADDFPCAIRERDQDIERPAAQPNRSVVLEQRPLRFGRSWVTAYRIFLSGKLD